MKPLNLEQAARGLLARRKRQREDGQSSRSYGNGHEDDWGKSATPRTPPTTASRPRPSCKPPATPPPKHLLRQRPRMPPQPPAVGPPQRLLRQARLAQPPSGPNRAEPAMRRVGKGAYRQPDTRWPADPPAPPRRQATARVSGAKLPRPPAWAPPREPVAKRKWAPPAPASKACPFPKDKFVQVHLGNEQEMPEFLEGFPSDGLAFSIEGKKLNLCAQADEILGRYFDNEEGSIKYSEGNNQVDDSYERFPEMGMALRDEIPDLEECFCIAKSDFHQIWAVGVSEKGRNRYQASRIALAAILVSQTLDAGEEVDLSSAGSFKVLLDALRAAPAEEAAAPSTPPRKKQKTASIDRDLEDETPPLAETEAEAEAEAGAEATGSTLPRDVPFFISFAEEESMPSILEGLPTQALVVSSEGKQKAIYSKADTLLSHVAGEAVADIEYHDDNDWSNFPEVGELLKQVADKEECLNIAISRAHDVWAVGVAMRCQSRFNAAKVALATALVMNAQDAGDPIDLSDFQQLDDFVQEAYAAMGVEGSED